MATKLKIKMGHIEFEYEGEAPYDTESVKDLFTHLETLMVAVPAGAFDTPASTPSASSNAADSDASGSSDLSKLGPNTVAARLAAKSGTDVAIAAAAYLQICQERQTFSRNELRSTMQSATTYYKGSMTANLTKILESLIKSNRINSLANDRMSLSAGEIAALEAKLAQH